MKEVNGRRLKKLDTFNIVNVLILAIWAIVIVYPFYNAVIISLVSPTDYVKNPLMLIPKSIDLSAYEFILQGKSLLVGYKNTSLILLFGLPYNITLTLTAAYVISRDKFPGKRVIVFLIYFTMFFSGGMIPSYLLIKGLGLINSLASVILLYGVNTFYLIISRTYFETIPPSMTESAKIDGANDIVILLKIMIPLAKPIIATIFLFYTVDRWNEWFNAMLYLNGVGKSPIQLVLRNIINNAYAAVSTSVARTQIPSFSDGVKMAAVVMTMTPVIILYPFVQKYFVKGMLVGAVKS